MDYVKLSTRNANYMTYPQNVEDLYKIAIKCKSYKDDEDKQHCLEIIRDTLNRFPVGIGKHGVKTYVTKALSGLSTHLRSTVPREEADHYIDIVIDKLSKGLKQYRESKKNEDVYWTARKIVGKNMDMKSSDLFEKVRETIRAKKEVAQLSKYDIGKIYKAIVDKKGINNDSK